MGSKNNQAANKKRADKRNKRESNKPAAVEIVSTRSFMGRKVGGEHSANRALALLKKFDIPLDSELEDETFDIQIGEGKLPPVYYTRDREPQVDLFTPMELNELRWNPRYDPYALSLALDIVGKTPIEYQAAPTLTFNIPKITLHEGEVGFMKEFNTRFTALLENAIKDGDPDDNLDAAE
jgi:hypothetical protein